MTMKCQNYATQPNLLMVCENVSFFLSDNEISYFMVCLVNDIKKCLMLLKLCYPFRPVYERISSSLVQLFPNKSVLLFFSLLTCWAQFTTRATWCLLLMGRLF